MDAQQTADACCEVNHAEHANFVETTDNWDRWGILLSTLCAIHCMLTPLLLLSLPVLGAYFDNEIVHIVMALFVVPVGVFAFWSGYRHHRKAYLLALGFVGLSLVGGAPILHDVGIEVVNPHFMTIVGSFLLIGAHILNRRACQCESHAHS